MKLISTRFCREALNCISRTALRTKLHEELADHLGDVCVDAILCINDKQAEVPIDLFMVEIMHMQHKSDLSSKVSTELPSLIRFLTPLLQGWASFVGFI